MKAKVSVKYMLMADRQSKTIITDYLPDKSNRVYAEEVKMLN